MELSLEEALDVVLEIISGGVAVAMMYAFMHTPSLTILLERMM